MISAQDEIPISVDKEQKYLLPLLGYIHGYKIGQNFALQLPPLILSPILVVPTMKDHQEIIIEKSTAEKNNKENEGSLEDFAPTEIINTQNNYSTEKKSELFTKVDDTTEFYNVSDNSSSEDDTFKQISSNETNNNYSDENSESNSDLETTPFSEEIIEVDNIQTTNTTRKPFGPYPNAIYNNSDINEISITVPPLQNNLTVPNKENKWQNFSSLPVNETENITSDFNNLNSTVDSIIYFPTTSSTINTYNPYPPRRYHQNVESLSITTNSYTNVEHHLPPAYDDRWQRFSSLEKSYLTSGFRPLAGLYYDGFLHKTLDKQAGFQPNRNYNYYNYI